MYFSLVQRLVFHCSPLIQYLVSPALKHVRRCDVVQRFVVSLVVGYCQINGPKLIESVDEYIQTSSIPARRPPPDIISYAVWLYYRFNLSHRDIEDILAERGIIVSREAIRL